MPGPHLRFAASLEITGEPRRWRDAAPFAAAALVAVAALGGIVAPAVYARETASWAAQGVGQDWVNLVVAAPWLVITGALALRGSRKAAVLVAAALLYVAYSFAIYAFAMHFNALFLVYCAALGTSVFGLIGHLAHLLGEPRALPCYGDRAPRRTAAVALLGVAGLFGVRWLADVVPALIRGEPPADLAATGLIVNPVEVLDLALVLPAMVAAGVGVLRRRRIGEILAPVLLGFAVLMAVAIGAMIAMMHARAIAVDRAGAAMMAVVAAVSLAALVGLVRDLR